MFSGTERSPQAEQADQEPKRLHDKRRQIEGEDERNDYQQCSACIQQ
jgi:hypothetical protein